MSVHFIEKCRHCEKVITQCRCPATDKTVILSVCEDCKAKGKKDIIKPDMDDFTGV